MGDLFLSYLYKKWMGDFQTKWLKTIRRDKQLTAQLLVGLTPMCNSRLHVNTYFDSSFSVCGKIIKEVHELKITGMTFSSNWAGHKNINLPFIE